MPKLTKRVVDSLKAEEKEQFAWDTEIAGFGVRVKPTGVKSYLVQYRHEGRTRRLTLGKHGVLTPVEARTRAQQLLAEAAAGGDPAGERRRGAGQAPTLRELAGRYLEEHAKPKKKASSVRHDESILRLHILPKLGSVRVSSLTSEDVGRLHHGMREKPYQANRTLALLSKMMNLAERWGLRPQNSNPCAHVDRYKERKRKRFLSGTELARLGETLAAIDEEGTEHPSAILALRLLLLTGARMGEILALRWDEVDFERACLRLRDSKTGEKVVHLAAPALRLLADAPRLDGNPYVCPGEREGHHLVGLPKMWQRIRERAGLEDVRIHDLRHYPECRIIPRRCS